MDEASITQHITAAFPDVQVESAWGATFFAYNPGRQQPHGVYFASLKASDDEYDRSSALDRPGVFRLNVGVPRDTFRALFGEGEGEPDLTALDRLMPHPVHARMSWICVLNPSAETFEALKPLLAEAHALAARGVERGREAKYNAG